MLGDDELLVKFEDFPRFRQAAIDALTNVEWPSPDHLYGPALDVDLSVRSIRRPADFPMLSRSTPTTTPKAQPRPSSDSRNYESAAGY